MLYFTVTYSKLDLQPSRFSLCNPSVRLSARVDRKLATNYALSINFVLYNVNTSLHIILHFRIVVENVTYFSVYSPKHSNSSLHSSASSLMMK